MKVHELAAILAHVDPTLEVHVSAGAHCRHIDLISRRARHHASSRLPNGSSIWPASLRIEASGRSPLWFEPAPDYWLEGPFLRRAELLAKLDGFA